jgi:hypothetical protein
MAIFKDFHDKKYDIIIPNCYWKIENDNGIRGGKTKLNIRLNCFKTKEVADTNKNKFCDFDFSFVPNITGSTDNFIVQAYNFVKTLPEFSGATNA